MSNTTDTGVPYVPPVGDIVVAPYAVGTNAISAQPSVWNALVPYDYGQLSDAQLTAMYWRGVQAGTMERAEQENPRLFKNVMGAIERGKQWEPLGIKKDPVVPVEQGGVVDVLKDWLWDLAEKMPEIASTGRPFERRGMVFGRGDAGLYEAVKAVAYPTMDFFERATTALAEIAPRARDDPLAFLEGVTPGVSQFLFTPRQSKYWESLFEAAAFINSARITRLFLPDRQPRNMVWEERRWRGALGALYRERALVDDAIERFPGSEAKARRYAMNFVKSLGVWRLGSTLKNWIQSAQREMGEAMRNYTKAEKLRHLTQMKGKVFPRIAGRSFTRGGGGRSRKRKHEDESESEEEMEY